MWEEDESEPKKAGRRAEAAFLSETGEIREKFLRFSPEDVDEEDSCEDLHKLAELFFPCGQPHNAYEEAYLDLMREAISARLTHLSALSSPL